jgi:hypothetical protein
VTITIYIDPGASGAFAWRDQDGIVHAEPMPDGMTAQIDRLRQWWCGDPCICADSVEAVVERVGGYMPGNSGPGAVKFARHCGHIEAALYALGIPTRQVAPAVWMRKLGTWPRDKAERKRAIKELVARLYPHLTVTLNTADALGMLAALEGDR